MIAPETLAAVLRVAQHGVHRAMLTARGDDAVDVNGCQEALFSGCEGAVLVFEL